MANELYVSDGTTAGTRMVTSFPFPCCWPRGLHQLAPVGGRLFFGVGQFSSSSDLWVSDGTAAGTRAVTSTGGLAPSDTTDFAGVAVFSGWDIFSGRELWSSDGTGAGTFRLADLDPNGDGAPAEFTVVGNTVYFSADDGSVGRELWKTDGTALGTVRVLDIQPGAIGSSPTGLVEMGGVLYFLADDGIHGRELWRSDGTSAGTFMVLDIAGGKTTGVTGELRVAGSGGALVFAANDGLGFEPWTSDGTRFGTRRLADIVSLAGSSAPQSFAAAGGQLLFSALDAARGIELWSMPISLTGASFVDTFGVGCTGGGTTPAQVGHVGLPVPANPSFAVTLSAAPSANAVLIAGTSRGPLNLSPGCTLYASLAAVLPLVTDAQGSAQVPIPPQPNYFGVTLYAQFLVGELGGAFNGIVNLSDALVASFGR